MGVGLVHALYSLDIRVVGIIFVSWTITVPIGAELSIAFFYLFWPIL